MQSDLFTLKILSKEGSLFDDKAISITSFNDVGKFDVLASHANFISLIHTQVDVIDKDGKNRSFPITNALMKVEQNDVKIYVGLEGIITKPPTS